VSGVAPFGPLSLLASIVTLLAPAWLMPIVALLLIGDRNVDKLRAANRKLRFLADIDMLTRVSNRRHFQRLASRVLQAAPDGTAALMMFDIDHFKRINDLLGHASGDEALRQVARCMRDTLRGHDVAGRLGGDEFAVVLPQTSVDAAMSVAARIVAQLDDRQVAPRLAPVSLSFGVVQVRRGETLAEALRRADQALYEAKRQGRSRAVVATGREERPVFGESRPLGLIAR
jgi:diguanylate cyclase (GGDEF)-like protein